MPVQLLLLWSTTESSGQVASCTRLEGAEGECATTAAEYRRGLRRCSERLAEWRRRCCSLTMASHLRLCCFADSRLHLLRRLLLAESGECVLLWPPLLPLEAGAIWPVALTEALLLPSDGAAAGERQLGWKSGRSVHGIGVGSVGTRHRDAPCTTRRRHSLHHCTRWLH
jgi:hypothetical protein